LNASAPKTLSKENRDRKHRGYWLRTMIQWHWISSAICLVGMILFSVTGITLNHAGEIETTPVVVTKEIDLPDEWLKVLSKHPEQATAPLPPDLAAWLGRRISKVIGSRKAEWSADEIYLSIPGPGSDAWLTIDRASGQVEFESTSRGWIAYFNDLHKGRNTGIAWKWFLDVFAIGSLIFCFTGLYLLYFHARHRQMTWPVVALGLVIPLVLAILMSHLP